MQPSEIVDLAEFPLDETPDIGVRSRETWTSNSSLEVEVSQDSVRSSSSGRLPTTTHSTNPHDSQILYGMGWQSAPATPPPEPGSQSPSQLISGVGRRFPSAMPSRAASLIISQGATDAGSTSSGALDASGSRDSLASLEQDLPDTLDAHTFSFDAASWPGSLGGSIFEPILPATPGPTPNRKRRSISPSAPRPAKRQRVCTEQLDQDAEEEAYPGGEAQGWATGEAFHNARMLTMDLIKTTGFSISEPEAEWETPNEGNTPSHTPPSSPHGLQLDGASGSLSERFDTQPGYTLKVEFFSEEQIEAYLAGHLSTYRAFHLGPDETEAPQPRSVDLASESWHALQAIFGDHLDSAADDDDDFLLQGEEEEVLNWMLIWARVQQTLRGPGPGPVEDLEEFLGQLDELATMAFVRKIE